MRDAKEPVTVSFSTITTIQTPTWSSEPSKGVQDMYLVFVWPSPAPLMEPRPPLPAPLLLPGLEFSYPFTDPDPFSASSLVGAGRPWGNHVTFAVTAAPCSKASARPVRTWGGPPMRERKGDWRRPGMRRAGETNIIRREGWGRTRRY